jgi:hypothetical protein
LSQNDFQAFSFNALIASLFFALCHVQFELKELKRRQEEEERRRQEEIVKRSPPPQPQPGGTDVQKLFSPPLTLRTIPLLCPPGTKFGYQDASWARVFNFRSGMLLLRKTA